MPKESTNLKLKLYNAITDAKEFAADWFNNIFDYTNSNWVKIDDAYKEVKDKFNNYTLKDGTGATGDWDINAKSATNDSIGQQIDATYIKDLRPTGDKIIITKGNNETSTIDGAAPKGYILTETIPASTVTGQTWFHVGSISNTSDGDLIKIEINCPTIVSTENNSVSYSKNITLFIHDLAQTNDSDLSTAYIFSYIMYDDKLKSSDVDVENNSTKKEFFYLIPTSGGNGHSNAELWINTDSTFFNSIINVSLAKKDNWGYVLKYSANAPYVDQAITPYSKTSIGGEMLQPATTTELGGIIVGEGLKVSDKGVLSSDVVIPEVDKLTSYPVGSIFETVSYTSPASMFGGIWEEIAQGRTLMGATDAQIAGTTVDAGLPNITGSFVANVYNRMHAVSGAFTAGNSLTSTGANDSYAEVHKFSLDASRSNPIYGASDTVRPPAYIVRIWERMGYLLNINSTPGCTLTITNGKTTVEDVVDDSGYYSRELPSTGTWIITASKDESVSTKTCAVNTYGVYTVDISLEVFGVVWNYGNNSTALTRLTRESDPYSFVSTNITSEPAPAVGASYGTSPFDKYMPWKGMEEYNIVNSVVGVKQGEQGFSRTNDTVVFIPEFYYKVVDDATNQKRYFYISSRWTSGFEKHPGSGRYVGKYNTASGYVSKTGLSPLTNITRATARTKSMEKGSGWYQYDYASWCAVVLLYIVEYADWNSSSKIGTGANKGISGRTDSMTYHTGEASTTSGVQYRHIENVFGNIETFVDGINFSGNNVYVCTNPDKYADNTDSGYTYVGTKIGFTGYIQALGFSKTAPWAFYPTVVGGNNTTYITDYCWNTSSGWTAMRSQGTGDEGILYMAIDKGSNNSGVSISTRLMFVPSKH